MATYQISINERTTLGKNLLGLLMSMPKTVSFEKKKTVKPEETQLYKDLQEAFHDVKLMTEGKKPKKSLDELIYELRNSND
ncbi:hypothetical protein FACS189446_7060 [Bacteroidia bacterium]|nr:hypothetical protein FACS189446_7060 [Bacteroidia bacterium]